MKGRIMPLTISQSWHGLLFGGVSTLRTAGSDGGVEAGVVCFGCRAGATGATGRGGPAAVIVIVVGTVTGGRVTVGGTTSGRAGSGAAIW